VADAADSSPSIPATPPSGPNIFGVVALALAVLGFITAVIPVASGFAWLFVLPAIVLAIIGLTRKGRPKRLALAGLIVAIVGWLVAIIVTVVTVIVGVGAVGDSLDEIPVPEAVSGDSVALGQPVTNTDGFTFTLDAVECGLSSTGADFFDDAPVGEWCRVDYTVQNDGTEAVSLLAGDVKLVSGDYAYDADDATGRFGADYFTTDVNPALSVPCVVFVDVPAGTTADSVVFEPALYFAAPVISSVN
jgi:hypothetical protein